MFQTFFALVRCRPGTAYEVGEKFAQTDLVKGIHSISGEWDLLLRIEANSNLNIGKELNDIVFEIENILKTKTFYAYHLFDPEDIYF